MNLKSQLESLLFVAIKPLSLKELAIATNAKNQVVEEALTALAQDYEKEKSGFRLLKNNNNYQLSTNPENADLVKDFLKSDLSGELSQPSLEALTIIAYRGPISKLELDRIRGVNCSLIIRNLLLRGLIEEKFEKLKNENFYSVTLDFIRFLGISRVEDLPDYERLNQSEVLKEAAFVDEDNKLI